MAQYILEVDGQMPRIIDEAELEQIYTKELQYSNDAYRQIKQLIDRGLTHVSAVMKVRKEAVIEGIKKEPLETA